MIFLVFSIFGICLFIYACLFLEALNIFVNSKSKIAKKRKKEKIKLNY